MSILFVMLALFLFTMAVWDYFDKRLLRKLIVEHEKEWNWIRSSLNLQGMTTRERNNVVGDAYFAYIDRLKRLRDAGKIKYCAFPRAPEAEPIIYKLVDGEWRET